jgi:hypothetical protein
MPNAMENFIYLMCTTPFGERCAQIGQDNFRQNTKLEAAAYINQLTRVFGQIPMGTFFQREWCSHELGEYLDIRFYYDDEVQAHVSYMSCIERGIERWDAAALEELLTSGYDLPKEKVIPIRQPVVAQLKIMGT